jgi:tetratricopeptide (TPR) repeat protein
MVDDRPAWARRMTNERKARGWSQADAVRAMRAHAPGQLPNDTNMLRNWKRWESGDVEPDRGKAKPFYKPIIAAMFGTVTHAMFPVPSQRDVDTDVLAMTGMDTLELVSRLQRSDLDPATLDGLRIMADRLCSEYPFMPPDQLLTEGRAWLRRILAMQGQRVSLKQHREILVQAGWVALLVGCVEYDTGNRRAAETTRQAALSLGVEADHGEIIGWAHEMRAWINLTSGDYHGVVAATRAGTEVTPHSSVAVQLAAQEAKAWARIGDRRQTEVALDKGRRLLDSLPYPENLDHHFVVDPTKFDFYAMDCYRMLADDKMAKNLASEVIQASTDFDGRERAPMRLAEARITLGVIAARQGDLEGAIHYGERALNGQRKSLPSLLMVSRDLTKVLNERYAAEASTKQYLDQIHAFSDVLRLPT